jgi:hypothetical protein
MTEKERREKARREKGTRQNARSTEGGARLCLAPPDSRGCSTLGADVEVQHTRKKAKERGGEVACCAAAVRA